MHLRSSYAYAYAYACVGVMYTYAIHVPAGHHCDMSINIRRTQAFNILILMLMLGRRHKGISFFYGYAY